VAGQVVADAQGVAQGDVVGNLARRKLVEPGEGGAPQVGRAGVVGVLDVDAAGERRARNATISWNGTSGGR
jgi:hypothetical protein